VATRRFAPVAAARLLAQPGSQRDRGFPGTPRPDPAGGGPRDHRAEFKRTVPAPAGRPRILLASANRTVRGALELLKVASRLGLRLHLDALNDGRLEVSPQSGDAHDKRVQLLRRHERTVVT